MYLLDTNTCIYYLNKYKNQLIKRMQSTDPSKITLCSIVKAELHYGAMKSRNPSKNITIQNQFINMFYSFSFSDPASHKYGEIRADLERQGTPIGPNDLLIASIALANDLILVTSNISEFSRINALQIEDWCENLS